tara:strand:- start:39440 stop:40660 length:1221 start_codon:yes stop_codon:yes gene_type:complete
MRIKQFLTEDVNTHLYHIEEEIIRNGLVGAKSAVRYLMGLVDMLGGNADADVRATVKWDGAPAIVCGKDPLNGKFFVGTKSVFNARTPKINYTFDDIDKNHQGGLAKVLKYAHRYLSGLNIQGVVQGDLMYIPGMLKPERIDGEAFLTFTPNTITYAVQKGSKLYDQITKSKIGIVFHTKYDGDTMDTLSASFGVDVSEFGQDSNVWYDDAYFKDFTGTATFKQSESLSLKTAIQKIDQLVDEVPMPLWMKLSTSKDFVQYMLQFINSQIKKGGVTQDPKQMMQQYINYYRDIQAQAKDKLKTDTAKLKRDQAVAVMGKLFAENERGVSAIIRIHNATMQIKNKIIKQINDVQSTKQFLKTDQGYQVTNPEGYVAIDNDGQAVKIVDRLTFSKANFSAQKLWAQEK